MTHRASWWAMLVAFVLSGAGCDATDSFTVSSAEMAHLLIPIPTVTTCSAVDLAPVCIDHDVERPCTPDDLLTWADTCVSRWWLRSPWLDVEATDPPRFVFKDAAVEQAIKMAVCGDPAVEIRMNTP